MQKQKDKKLNSWRMARKDTRILFLNTGTGKNLGDRAMLLNVVRLARSQLPRAALHVSADAPRWLAQEFDLHQTPTLLHIWGRWEGAGVAKCLPVLLRKALSPSYNFLSSLTCLLLAFLPAAIRRHIPGMEGEFINSIAEMDVVYFNGGGYLTDKGMTEARALLWTALIAHWHGARIVLTGQGLGPFSSYWTQWLVRHVLNSADFIITREMEAAAQWFDQWKISDGRWHGGVDDACSLPYKAVTPGSDKPILAIHNRTSSFHTDEARVSRALVAVMREHLARGYRIKLFVFQKNEKMELAIYRKWMEEMGCDSIDIVNTEDPRELRAELAVCERAVGVAYHFQLFSLMAGMPSVAIYRDEYYRAKFAGLAKLFQRPESYLNVSNLDAESIIARLDKMGVQDDSALRRHDSEQHAIACDHQIMSALRVPAQFHICNSNNL